MFQLDRLLGFVDLNRSELEDARREALYTYLEKAAAERDQLNVVFGREDGDVVELDPDKDFTGPRTILSKTNNSALKVSRTIF